MLGKLELDIEVMINEYSNYVFKIINNLVGDSLTYQDKEEIVSDTFYLFWKNQDKVEKNIKAYLGTIAKNLALRRVNKRQNNVMLDENIIGYEALIDNKLFIYEIVNVLSNDEKDIFILYYVKGYKIKEIAKSLNLSISNVKVKLYRIRKRLREVA